MTRAALLRHMHHPYYEDLAIRQHILSWVRLHALKDYGEETSYFEWLGAGVLEVRQVAGAMHQSNRRQRRSHWSTSGSTLNGCAFALAGRPSR